MSKVAFVGFGEVNTPIDIIIRKCENAAAELEKAGLELVKVYPVTDDYMETDIKKTVSVLQGQSFDCLVVCIAGCIESDGRVVTTADQAGATALRKTFAAFWASRSFDIKTDCGRTTVCSFYIWKILCYKNITIPLRIMPI